MQYIIYCDESEKRGKYFSNFYGGALVRSNDFHIVRGSLELKKEELNLFNEVKWQKVTEKYLDKYKQLMDQFFYYVKRDKIKVRIMFTHNRYEINQLSYYQQQNEYFILYYQFFKHAFGLIYSNSNPKKRVSIYPFFDQLPDTKKKNQAFINFIYKLQFDPDFQLNNIVIHSKDDIAEAESHNHVILQCIDIVLGAMEFRLNNKHLAKADGSKRRGKRTIAKEKLYKHIYSHIRDIYPNFNIGESTGTNGDKSKRWKHSYRHWKFIPREAVYNKAYRPKNK
ncbi:DUF3800 domain-containing protein [Lentibacillus sp. CBA3610]|uniref:DUF3800 domain-containing protein n=1 Tax=Lentibacillus sp. CBA3610 TaxID=2518176 RepID=UPI001595CF9F|nr:DUF3800 domain-containing protein [Lentibacillus sp. CBA3610]QKY70201.1 hypothetical protein Len3610_11900 [Lentibacillus sp. CBA3610]